MSSNWIVWMGAILTLGAFSYLFKENAFYKAIEHCYVGVAAGYTIVMGYVNIVDKVWKPLTGKGEVVVILPAILGLMLFAGYVGGSQFRFLRRYPIACITGVGAGISVRTAIEQQFVRQLSATILPLNTLDNVIIVVGFASVLSYFFFTLKNNPVLANASNFGKWVIMVTFGAAFGNAIMGRISLLIGRVQFLFGDWIYLIKAR